MAKRDAAKVSTTTVHIAASLTGENSLDAVQLAPDMEVGVWPWTTIGLMGPSMSRSPLSAS